jgi:glutamyl-tRNA synthetase
MKKIRLRFAPSPTGFIHIGSVRTLLFDYLLAKYLNGQLILRIEDTDQSRLVEGSLDNLLKVCNKLNIEFDEGPHIGGNYGPYIQSQRKDIYKKYIEELLEKKAAYPCFCDCTRLEEMRQEQQKNKQAPGYDGLCRHLSKEEVKTRISKGEAYVVRQKMPRQGTVEVYDELRGKITFSAKDLDDQVLMKRDGMPTYQLANVVDDHLMEISHVSRGEEWIPSLPKNVLLYKSFNWLVPKFIHFPLILNKEGGKLSKRQGDVFIEDYFKQGYLPEAIINFCALLGWHPKEENEIFSLKELKNIFSLNRLGTSPAIFDLEKLEYFNSYYIKRKNEDDLYDLAKPILVKNGLINKEDKEKERTKKVLQLARERVKKLEEIPQLFAFLFKDIEYDKSMLAWKKSSLAESKENLKELLLILESENDWTLKNLEEKILNYIKENNKKNGDYLWPMRVALSGEKFSPSPFELAWALEKPETLKRLKEAINKLN